MRIKNLPSIESMDGSQDALVIEQTDGSEDKSRKVSPAQLKQYVLGNSIDDIYSVMGEMGAKNLIPYPYYRASGYSSNGMTITYDSDGVLTINKVAGSSTAYFSLIVNDQDYCFKPNTEYKLLLELENANQLTIYLKYGDADIVLINKKSTGKYVVNFTTPQTLQGRENLAINAAASDTETNAKVKVMIMLASDTDDTYQPYAKTNKQLTEVIGDLSQTGLTGDSVAEQLDTAREQIAEINSKIGTNSGTLTERIHLSASGDDSYTVTADSAIIVMHLEGYLSAPSDAYDANVQVNGLVIGYLGLREGVACNPTKREQIRIPFRVFKNDVIKITLSITGSAVGIAALFTT